MLHVTLDIDNLQTTDFVIVYVPLSGLIMGIPVQMMDHCMAGLLATLLIVIV
jgi:hypothetical protein